MHPAKTTEVDLDEFVVRRKEFAASIRESRENVVATINGEPAIVMVDLTTYSEMQDALDKVRLIEGVQRGLDAAERGDVFSISEAKARLRNTFPFLRPA
jgi:PHD/YefM family antitoxin component YafN of YafNO toxin-antitoxin module